MNNDRRKRIEAVRSEIEKLDEQRQRIYDMIDEIAGEESDAFDNLPESLQDADKGQAMEAARDALYEARDFFENMDMSEANGYLDTACE